MIVERKSEGILTQKFSDSSGKKYYENLSDWLNKLKIGEICYIYIFFKSNEDEIK